MTVPDCGQPSMCETPCYMKLRATLGEALNRASLACQLANAQRPCEELAFTASPVKMWLVVGLVFGSDREISSLLRGPAARRCSVVFCIQAVLEMNQSLALDYAGTPEEQQQFALERPLDRLSQPLQRAISLKTGTSGAEPGEKAR